MEIIEDTGTTAPISNAGSDLEGILRSKSSYRVTFESEKDVIQKELGGLEQIRTRLGLSRRKICQILMVDPSAWTRWTASEKGAPPHVYRMLEWYLLLKEKHPTLAHQYYERLSQPVRPEGEALLRQELLHHLKSTESRIKTDWSHEMDRLKTQVKNLSAATNVATSAAAASVESSLNTAGSSTLRVLVAAGAFGFSMGILGWVLAGFFLK